MDNKKLEQLINNTKENIRFAKSWLRMNAWSTEKAKIQMEECLKCYEIFLEDLINLKK